MSKWFQESVLDEIFRKTINLIVYNPHFTVKRNKKEGKEKTNPNLKLLFPAKTKEKKETGDRHRDPIRRVQIIEFRWFKLISFFF